MNNIFKYLLTVVIYILCCSIATAQSLMLDKQTHNFGTIQEKNGVVKHTFLIKNISTKPFVINYVTTGCGCTETVYDKSPIMPEKTRELSVTYDPSGRTGLFKTAINIVGISPQEDYNLYVIGNIIPEQKSLTQNYPYAISNDIRLKDNSIIFGNIPTEETHTMFVPYYNNSQNSVTLSVSNKGNKFGKCWLTKSALKPNDIGYIMYEMNLLESNNFLGDIHDEVTIKVNGIEQQLKLLVSAISINNFHSMTSKQLDASPVVLTDGNLKEFTMGRSNNRNIVFEIENSGEGWLEINKIVKKTEGVEYYQSFSKLKRGEKGKITLTLPSDLSSEEKNVRVLLITNSPHTPIITLTVSIKKN